MGASKLSPSGCFQALLAFAGGWALFFLALVGLVFAYDMVYFGAIYPGVSMAGIDLTGKTPEEAAGLLSQQITFPQTGKIVFHRGVDTWAATPEEVGLYLDPEMSAMAAYSVGRQGSLVQRVADQFNAWYRGREMPPLLVYDERRAQNFVEQIAGQLNLPTIEATLEINGTEVIAKPGQIGRTVDVEKTLAPLETQFSSLTDGLVPLVIYETPPQILDVSEQAEAARKILSTPLTLTLPEAGEGDPGPWNIPPDQLAKMIVVRRVDGGSEAGADDGGAEDGGRGSESGSTSRYEVGLNAEGLRSFLEELSPSLKRTPADARFIFNDESRQLEVIQPSVTGRALDVDKTIEVINERLPMGEHEIPVALDITPPQVGSEARAEELGIRELVSNQTTYFYGSSASRLHNIEVAAARFHGVLVPPGATFSMAETLGDVSLDNGYAEALIIYGNRTIQGVGGGVCQVSTTLFRTVFFGGYPIVERNPHAYRVGYYEQTPGGGYDTQLAGLEATVYVPVVDFKFKNDTENWLLMETYFNPGSYSLTWKFYSTSDGRRVEWDSTGLRNTTEPPEPLYEENPDLPEGEIKQVDWAVEGGDVTVYRTVLHGDAVYFEDSYHTAYIPWRAVYQYGPGTDIPDRSESE